MQTSLQLFVFFMVQLPAKNRNKTNFKYILLLRNNYYKLLRGNNKRFFDWWLKLLLHIKN